MDRLGRHAAPVERLGNAVGAALGAGKDDHALEVGVGKQMAEQRPLGRGVHEVDTLVDAIDGAALRGDLDAIGIAQDVGGELRHVVRHGRREQQRLPLLRDRSHDAAHVLDETHVEHAIGFVEDEERHVPQADIAALDEIEQATRRGDEDVDATVQRLDLPAEAQAADHHAKTQAEAAPIGVEAARDLRGKLARRRKHQRPRALRLRPSALLGKLLQHGQREGRRLAGARLGNPQHVAALQERGYGTRLDRRGVGVVGRVQRTQQRLGQSEIRERNISHWKNKSLRPLALSGFSTRSRARLGGLFLLGDCLGMKRLLNGRVARSRDNLADPHACGSPRI